MALEKVSSIGDSIKLSCSIPVNNINGYSTSDNYLNTTTNNFYFSLGLNVLTVANDSTIAKTKNGYSIKITGKREYTNTIEFTIGLYNASNARVSSRYYYLERYPRGTTTRFYICAQIDEENRELYLVGTHEEEYDGQLKLDAKRIFEVTPAQLYSYLNTTKVYDTDPWSGAGYAEIGGGNGTFNFESDVISLPSLPSVNAISSGFLQLFSGSLTQILNLSKYLWSSNFFDSFTKAFLNPMDIILGLYLYPFNIVSSGNKYVRAGNVITDIIMGVPSNQIYEIDCGSLTVPNFYGAYIDFEPFTKCEIYLPYCGTYNISVDDIMGKTVSVKYRVDLLTGVCCAYIIVENSILYSFSGLCAINIPVSSRSFENVYSALMNVISSSAGGSFSAPSSGALAGVVSAGKHQISHGGNATGNSSFLGVQKPYFIFNIPRVAIPKNQNLLTGYPIYATYTLSKLKGYTEIEEIHLENLGSATAEEQRMIEQKLKEGIIL